MRIIQALHERPKTLGELALEFHVRKPFLEPLLDQLINEGIVVFFGAKRRSGRDALFRTYALVLPGLKCVGRADLSTARLIARSLTNVTTSTHVIAVFMNSHRDVQIISDDHQDYEIAVDRHGHDLVGIYVPGPIRHTLIDQIAIDILERAREIEMGATTIVGAKPSH
ncbi:hypothetical protein [Dyella japonica]|uniref:Uncharacterized protein n=1 Tax=Dyella japonica DSM 16301 TaxID=1440762 RepID=A0A0G9HA52_9GAMM|nr:hypothetical protein [Dyella japonica]KLD64587.1 hypothetical protein Y882_06910 [Dyella japonica DSM 16301]